MKIYTKVAVLLLALSPFISSAQIDIPASCATPVVDFTGFTGAGFDPNPGPGQLDSDAFATEGFGTNVPFGGSESSGDPARGVTTGGEGTGGVYSLDNGGNAALWIQPAGSDFTPGAIKMKSCNTSGATVADIELSYDIVYLNDQNRANSLNFTYSLDDVLYQPVPALDFITPEASDALGIQTVGRATTLVGLNIPDGMCVFFAWRGDDETGGGSRDEYGIDNIALCGSGIAPPPPPGPPANPYCIASDDFDSPTNLISRNITVDMTFMNIGDMWGIGNSYSGPPVNTPFSVIDDTNPACANYFPNDNQGVIPCSYGNQFFGMTDTENPDNMGPVSAEWVFNIASATNLTAITIDMSAMGDFETSNDHFVWSYSIDGGPSTIIFDMMPDESASADYTLFDGSVVTLNDPMTVNGTLLLNQMTTFSAPINGAGNQLTLKVEGMGDGGSEAIAWDNITIKGITAGVAVPTMGEWSLFLFAIIMLTLGVVFVFNAQRRLALNGAGQLASNAKMSQLPFEIDLFKSSLMHAFGLALVGFGVIFTYWGEIVPADLVGMALTIPVVAYLIHLVKMFDRK